MYARFELDIKYYRDHVVERQNEIVMVLLTY